MQTLLQVVLLSDLVVLAKRRRVETDASSSVLSLLLVVCVSATSESA